MNGRIVRRDRIVVRRDRTTNMIRFTGLVGRSEKEEEEEVICLLNAENSLFS